jgi:deoxyribodipyrimidine photo-lyase
MPETIEKLSAALINPVRDHGLGIPLDIPKGAITAHPFKGGERAGQERIAYLLVSGGMTAYKDTRNGLVGEDYSTKLSAYLSLGSITSRQIHYGMFEFEEGRTPTSLPHAKPITANDLKVAPGFGMGENKGTAAVRFELLWRDYMRLCLRKFKTRTFELSGFKGDCSTTWKTVPSPYGFPGSYPKHRTEPVSKDVVQRFIAGETGTGLVDASQRELLSTGYTSNRARQNVASYLAKHLQIDWRIGAEWYEYLLVDYDVASNWANWQYVAGVGNDPRGSDRIFNPIKQSWDYDPNGDFIRMWIPELRAVEKAENVFQAWTLGEQEKAEIGLKGVQWVEEPLKRIQWNAARGRSNNRGNGGGGPIGGKGGRGSSAGGGRGRARGGERRGRGRSAHQLGQPGGKEHRKDGGTWGSELGPLHGSNDS